MDEFLADLRELDETQERVEAVSECMLRAQRDPDRARAQEMVEHWIQALRASDFQAERVAYLYVANHVLLKTLFSDDAAPKDAAESFYVELFRPYLEEAVALVCNSPMDRQNVTGLLEIWHDKTVFSDDDVLSLWKCTGEDLPPFLEAVDKDPHTAKGGSEGSTADPEGLPDSQDAEAALPHALPMKLNAHSANPVLNVLKQIDRQTAAVRFLDRQIKERHQALLQDAAPRFQTAEDLAADRSTSADQLKQRVEDCLRLVKARNKFIQETANLKTQLTDAIARMTDYEESEANNIEEKLEKCDEIDMGLVDLSEHRTKFPEQWSQAAYVCMERRKQREEQQRQKDEEIARLHHAAIAESNAHAIHLERDMNANSSSELQSISKEFEDRSQEKGHKPPEEEKEFVWHPILKELVPLESLNVEWESWRDH